MNSCHLVTPSGKKFSLQRRSKSVYLGTSIITGKDGKEGEGEKVAVKIKDIKAEHRPLQHEFDVNLSLIGGIGIPFFRSYNATNTREILTMDLLGPNLKDLFDLCHHKFTLKTVLLLADQLIPRIRYIHSCSLACDAGNPKNWAIGCGKYGNQVYLTNFSLARFRHSDVEPCYRDLESLAYMMIGFLRGFARDPKTKSTKKLCRGLPQEFATYLNYTRNRRLEEPPDYSYLRKILNDLFIRMRFDRDWLSDWTIRKYRKTAQATTKSFKRAFKDFFIRLDFQVDYIFGRTMRKYMKQLKSRPLSQAQLYAELNGVYAGLWMVEKKCFEVDKKHVEVDEERRRDPQSHPKLTDMQWQALIELHQTLIFEHHDFFLISRHPAASEYLFTLASELKMAPRMWYYGIHDFLELLRENLLESRDTFLSFFPLAYSLVALLYETAPEFDKIWTECLYTLADYRTAIEDAGTRDREIWEAIARRWNELRDPSVASFANTRPDLDEMPSLIANFEFTLREKEVPWDLSSSNSSFCKASVKSPPRRPLLSFFSTFSEIFICMPRVADSI